MVRAFEDNMTILFCKVDQMLFPATGKIQKLTNACAVQRKQTFLDLR